MSVETLEPIASIEDAERLIRDKNIDTIEAGFGDVQGALRGKRFSAARLTTLARSGFGFCNGVMAWDIQCDVFPTELVPSFEGGYPDFVARPILETLREVPWRPGSAFVLCDLVGEDGEPLAEISPREILKGVLARANALGYRPVVGTELEFYLLNEDHTPFYEGVQCYSLHRGAQVEPIVRDIRNHLEAFGIPIEASHVEYGPGQVELNLVYGDALEIANRTLLFKQAVKEIARQHGLMASFMPKPWAEQSGSGFHVHLSLWDLDREENMFGGKDHALAERALAGLVATTRDFTALVAPSINAYKRVREQAFVPLAASWGRDNRNVATRSLVSHGPASRLEQRNGASDANPYLVIAAAIAGALHGIENNLTPPPETRGDGSDAAPEARLSTTLREALALLESSRAATAWFPEAFVRHYLSIGRHEADLYDKAVTDWERDRYLELA